MKIFNHEIDITSKNFWISVLLFLGVCIYSYKFDIHSSEFICNPTQCEVIDKNVRGKIINKKPVKIDQIQSFEIYRYYNSFEGGRRKHYRETVYAIPKYGKPYRFMKASSQEKSNHAENVVTELNRILPTTQDKIDVYIKF